MKQKILLLISIVLSTCIIFFVISQNHSSNATFSNFGATLPEHNQILGIDVSHHQGKIDWNKALKMKINKDSIQFVYLKVTEGNTFTDPEYARNRKMLDRKSVKVGVYHFYTPGLNVREQANHFISSFKKTSLKPVIDVEEIGALSKSQLTDSIALFASIVKKKLGINPIIYTYESFYKDYFKGGALDHNIFWIASYSKKCTICNQSNIVAWQFSDKGTINGISEKVDLNSAQDQFWEKALW